MAEKTYTVIEDGQKIVNKLVERYPDVLWQVREGQVAVLGIENKEAGKKAKDFTVKSVKNAERAILVMNDIKVRYIIEFYYSRWNEWDDARREWTILNALLRISVDEEKLIAPDCVDFRIFLDIVSFDWTIEGADLPSLTSGDPIKFDLDLRPGIDDEAEGEED
jgi:hypothetical protein